MSKRSVLTQLALMAVLAGGVHSVAMAAAQRTFVASNGSDANPCSLANPCRSFNTAIGQTLVDGEVIVLDSAGYGTATISQAVSINAPPGIYAGVSVFSGVGITVSAGAGKVTLRGLTINNVQTGTTGIAFNSGAVLYLDNVVVTNFPTAGLSANVGVNSSLFVTNSTFHDNGTGALLNATAGTLTVSIDQTLFARNGVGRRPSRRHRRHDPWLDTHRRHDRALGRADDRREDLEGRGPRLHDRRQQRHRRGRRVGRRRAGAGQPGQLADFGQRDRDPSNRRRQFGVRLRQHDHPQHHRPRLRDLRHRGVRHRQPPRQQHQSKRVLVDGTQAVAGATACPARKRPTSDRHDCGALARAAGRAMSRGGAYGRI